jgi:hypothetical protein
MQAWQLAQTTPNLKWGSSKIQCFVLHKTIKHKEYDASSEQQDNMATAIQAISQELHLQGLGLGQIKWPL